MAKHSNIRLASYNIRKCVGLDRCRKPERIIDVLNSLGADVIVLQEADRRLGDRPAALPARLIENETDFHNVHLSPDGPSIGWHGNAVLVRKGIEVTDIGLLDLPGTEPRGAVSVRLKSGPHLIATHLGLLRRDRRRQLDAILAEIGGNARNTAILGDFNEWSSSRGLEALASDFKMHSPGYSYHAARPVAALDRVALGSGLKLHDAGVRETRLTRIASDHLPIWADIKLVN